MRSNTQNRYDASCRFLSNVESGGFGERDDAPPARSLRGRDRPHPRHTRLPPRPRSICCHPGRYASATAASMVVELSGEQIPPIAWCSMASPCTGVFLPVQVGSALPAAMMIGGDTEDYTSLWWAMHTLAAIVDHDPGALSAGVQQVWRAREDELFSATAADAQSAARDLPARVAALLDRCSELVEAIRDAAPAAASLTT